MRRRRQFRRRERKTRDFKGRASLQRFLETHGAVCNTSNMHSQQDCPASIRVAPQLRGGRPAMSHRRCSFGASGAYWSDYVCPGRSLTVGRRRSRRPAWGDRRRGCTGPFAVALNFSDSASFSMVLPCHRDLAGFHNREDRPHRESGTRSRSESLQASRHPPQRLQSAASVRRRCQ